MAPLPHKIAQRPSRRLALLLLGAVIVACAITLPVILPPPFGPAVGATAPAAAPYPPYLFFPTGLAVAPSGQLLVNNANFDRSYASGTMLSFSKEFIDAQYATDPTVDPRTSPVTDISAGVVGAVMVSNFAGPITFDPSGVVAYTGSRETNLVTMVQLDPVSGVLSCLQYGGTDCRAGTVNTSTAVVAGTPNATNVEGPYGIVPGNARVPGSDTLVPVMFVAGLVPYVDQIINGTPFTSGRLAALQVSIPGNIIIGIEASTSVTLASGVGAGPILFDNFRRQVILGGCYQRYGAGSGGDPQSGKCTVSLGTNPLRFIDVDSGSDAVVRVFDLYGTVKGNETSGLAFGDQDATGMAHTLYAVTRNPDILVELTLPTVVGEDPIVRRTTALPLAPSGALRLDRPPELPGPDLVAIAGSVNSSLSIFDTGSGQVVAQLPDLGDYPFALAQLPVSGTTARFVATIFGSCQLAFFEVDYAQPQNARLRSLVGACAP